MSQAFRILMALVLGVTLGIALANWAPEPGAHVLYVTKLIGGAWLHGLQMVIVPLVVALLVVGIAASAEAAKAGRIAGRALIEVIDRQTLQFSVNFAAHVVNHVLFKRVVDADPNAVEQITQDERSD